MTKDEIEDIFARVRTWSPDRQEAAVDLLLALEEDSTDLYELSPEELCDIEKGLAAAGRGEFATEEEIGRVFRRNR